MTPDRPGPGRAQALMAAVGAAALAACAALVGAVGLLGDGDSGTDAGADLGIGEDGEATVAVTYGRGTVVGRGIEVRLAFTRADGTPIVERTWGGDPIAAAGGEDAPDDARVAGGLVQGVPAGDIALQATLVTDTGTASCRQPFTAAADDRLILRLALRPSDAGATSAAEPCAPIETVAEWVEGRTGPTGQGYTGIGLELAEARAAVDGVTTRVVAVDGVDLAVTADFVPDRLNLTLFDDDVVAAHLDGQGPL